MPLIGIAVATAMVMAMEMATAMALTSPPPIQCTWVPCNILYCTLEGPKKFKSIGSNLCGDALLYIGMFLALFSEICLDCRPRSMWKTGMYIELVGGKWMVVSMCPMYGTYGPQRAPDLVTLTTLHKTMNKFCPDLGPSSRWPLLGLLMRLFCPEIWSLIHLRI